MATDFLGLITGSLKMLKNITLFLLFSHLSIFNTVWATEVVGPKECKECHEREFDVWKTTPHFKSYKKVHREKKAKAIISALGKKSMKRTPECVLCHYTKIKNKPKAGPSCESCHGLASKWKEIHNDFGKNSAGERIKKAKQEDPAHRVQRLKDAEAAGMIASRMVYDIASSCMRCHGLSNPELSKETLNIMLENDHPVEKDFEIVKYSQGQVRHRFIPPNVNENSKLEPAELARLFIGGQLASYAAAQSVEGKSQHPKFTESQQHRQQSAQKNLQSLAKSLPEISAFLKEPNVKNGHKVVAAMRGKDLSAAVANMLPKAVDYK